MTKEDILHHFQDINFYYGDCMMYADLSGMLDELIAENKAEWLDDVKTEIEQKAWDTQEADGEHDNYEVVDLSDVLEILDSIGKGDKE